MSAKEGQLLPRHSSETESDIMAFSKLAASLNQKNSGILADGHDNQLDTVSLTEKLTKGIGFFKAIGIERSNRLAVALRSLTANETKLIEEVSLRPIKLALAYLDLLEKAEGYNLRIKEIQKKVKSLQDNSLTDRWQEVVDRANLLIKSYQAIHPGLAEEILQKFFMIRKKYETELDEIDANNSLNDMEKKRRCEQVLDQFRRRIGML
jgi:hypothetical protein